MSRRATELGDGVSVDEQDGVSVDQQDAALSEQIEAMGVGVLVTDTVMRCPDDRARLACEVVTFADHLRPDKLGGCKL